jgi:hypothetical protein
VPTFVELVEPLKPFTRTLEACGGLIKSDALLEMQAVAPPSTRISYESESKIALEEHLEGTAEFTLATPEATADRERIVVRTRKPRRLRTYHDRKFHLQNRYWLAQYLMAAEFGMAPNKLKEHGRTVGVEAGPLPVDRHLRCTEIQGASRSAAVSMETLIQSKSNVK